MYTELFFFGNSDVSAIGCVRGLIAFLPLFLFLLPLHHVLLYPYIKHEWKVYLYTFIIALFVASMFGVQNPSTLDEEIVFDLLVTLVVHAIHFSLSFVLEGFSIKVYLFSMVYVILLSIGVSYILWENAPTFNSINNK